MNKARKSSYCNPWLIVIISICFIWLFSGCFNSSGKVPASGLWYCEKLGITLDFDTGKGYVFAENKEIECIIENDRGTNFIGVLNQDPEADYYYLGESVFGGECLDVDEEKLIVEEYRTKEIFTFIAQKTEDGSLSP